MARSHVFWYGVPGDLVRGDGPCGCIEAADAEDAARRLCRDHGWDTLPDGTVIVPWQAGARRNAGPDLWRTIANLSAAAADTPPADSRAAGEAPRAVWRDASGRLRLRAPFRRRTG